MPKRKSADLSLLTIPEKIVELSVWFEGLTPSFNFDVPEKVMMAFTFRRWATHFRTLRHADWLKHNVLPKARELAPKIPEEDAMTIKRLLEEIKQEVLEGTWFFQSFSLYLATYIFNLMLCHPTWSLEPTLSSKDMKCKSARQRIIYMTKFTPVTKLILVRHQSTTFSKCT